MKAGVFVWNVTNDYTKGRVAIDDTLGAMNPVLFKVNDGLEYQTYSPDDTRQHADDIYRSQGIDFLPWGVARGWYADWAYAEGRLAGEHAAAARREYVLDLEPYPEDYWQGVTGTPRAFCKGYMETSDALSLRLCTDARNPGINLEEWAKEPIVSLVHPQIYHRLFNESLDSWLKRGVDPIIGVGISRSRIYPVLAVSGPGTGDPSISPDDLEADINALKAKGFPGFALWRRGVMSSQQVERLLSMADPFAPPAPPPVTAPPPPVQSSKDKALAFIESARIAVEAI